MEDISKDEAKTIIDTLTKMGVKPKADTPAEFEQWMKDYVASKGDMPVKSETKEISKSTVSTHIQVPNIPPFSGLIKPGSNDASYEDWKFHVTSLLSDKYHSESVIMQAIRRSLRGQASGVLRRLGVHASLSDVLHKMNQMYGTIEKEEDILKEFYNAEQQDEDVNAWSCRLEEILYRADSKLSLGSTKINEMLRNKFWTGLRKSLKDISGHKFDRIMDFDELRVAIREIETEQNKQKQESSKRPNPLKMAATTSDKQSTEISELKDIMMQMKSEFTSLQQQVLDMKRQTNQPIYEYKQQQQQQPFQQQQQRQQRQPFQGEQGYNNTGYRDRQQRQSRQNHTGFPTVDYQTLPQHQNVPSYQNVLDSGTGTIGRGRGRDMRNIQCYRCGYYGHMAVNCRVRLDHRRNQGLNGNQSIGRGSQ